MNADRVVNTGRASLRLAVVALALVATLGFGAAAAHAEFGITPDPMDPSKPFVADVFADAANTVPDTQAGATPFQAVNAISFNRLDPATPDEYVKDIEVDLPPGFVAYPPSYPRCSRLDFDKIVFGGSACPVDSQVGVADAIVRNSAGTVNRYTVAVYNLDPYGDDVGGLGFRIVTTNIEIRAKVRPGDHAVRAFVSNVPDPLPLLRSVVTLWGVPSDPAHDAERNRVCNGTEEVPNTLCFRAPPGGGLIPNPPPQASNAPRRAFLRNPTFCGPPLETTLRVASWERPDVVKPYVTTTDSGATGCDRLQFAPAVDMRPDTSAPDSPAGLAVDIDLPQSSDPNGLATAHLRDVKVTFPEGMTINPSSADGLAACPDDQLALGTDDGLSSDAPICPGASKIGTVEAISPALEQPVKGGVYLRPQASDDPESGELFRLALVLKSRQPGVLIKLPGSVRADSGTGRLTAEFANNPQLPVSSVSLRLKGGSRAPLATPRDCGEHTIETELTSWAGHNVTTTSAFTIDCVGGTGFAPSFASGSVNPLAGAFSPFAARIGRNDRQQFLSGVSVDLPEGLLAKVHGVSLCGSVQAEHGGCPAGSRVGTATVGAGPGSSPYYVKGDVFLTEGYKGGPYGLAAHVHAKAGPFDLGWVRVRQALYVDRVTAEVSVVSDPLPQIVKGVPVRLRDVRVDVDKPDFTVNPTSCSEQRIDASLTSINGAQHRTGSRFQVGDCQALPFKPRLGLRLTGRKQIRTGRHPGVRAVVRQSGIGEAGIGRARVVLPKSLALDPENAQALCEFEDGTKPDLESHCPKGSIVGRARAKTPLLNKDLVGDVYFVKNVRIDKKTGNEIRTLPMIVVALRGEIAINLTGKSSTIKSGRLVNTFANVPDAPIGRFNLNIKGGKNGILAVTRTRKAKINLCAKPKSHVADVDMDGQNGKRADFATRVKTPCGKAGKKSKRRASASVG